MLNCKAEDRQVDGLFINSLIVLLFLLLLCFCGSFCHLPCVRAASDSYREKEQRGGGVETKERNKGFGEYQGKKSGSSWSSTRTENKTRLNSKRSSALARFRSPKQRVGILENQGIPPSCLGNKSSAPSTGTQNPSLLN